jgi:hypothetical protein
VRWPPVWALFLGQSPASKDVNTEAEEATALGAVTRLQPVNIHYSRLRRVHACRSELCELTIELQLIVVTYSKCSINPTTNPNPVYSHSIT